MRGIICEKYGAPEVLELVEMDKPELKEDELLIKVQAITVSSGDSRIRRGTKQSLPLWPVSKMVIGLRKPRKKILGMDFSGVIEAVGKEVTKFKAGDEVYGFCGKGTYREYITVKESGSVAHRPESINFEEAAAVPFGAMSALDFLRKGAISEGKKILVYGASGSVGTYAIQLAKYYGAEVTGVCSSVNVELVKSLGADAVIDYKEEDFTNNGKTYDIIFDTLGKTSFKQCRHSLKEHGNYVVAVFDFPEILQMFWTSKVGDKKVIGGIAGEKKEDLEFLRGLIEEGKIKAVIDRKYPLEQIREAHLYVDQGHKKGNVVITMN
ncbi:NAD(P)-dependent alcohol dehydrogenase [Halobacillus yeomjeoni]|uniref:NAD(P)-dependent alcohol dehydrogenase n=1 Tax=Halobacillus yeomjeoni TaxID=311194 RepID=A0A931MTF0_9BACI|nr:NAD(P)-dependent alcohol dehydrogenase [Halobacillus yeomjeoni]MBH0228868.1 NAD(P)-dependent alcohol dehydrogenase [Halobacillus yeomjeoni]